MAGFLGEAECKIDAKGRLLMPAKFLKQMPQNNADVLVINKGIEKCLNLYTLSEWNKISENINNLNSFDPKVRLFRRLHFSGVDELKIDGNRRILLPKRLLQYANIKKELVMVGFFNQIEIWEADYYYKMLDNVQPDDYAELAEEVMSSGTIVGGGGVPSRV
ncbi:MAG: division/cell wall cluster transcriptional repressor MraZ [Chitinophagales bacterium]